LNVRTAVAIALVVMSVPVARGEAQRLATVRSFSPRPTPPGISDRPFANLPALAADSNARSTPWAILASAIVPGAGQAILKQDRVVAYLAIEAYSWVRYVADAREGQQARSTYRNLASEVARRPFSATRPLGDFDYYERMEKFVESGAFDAIPGGDLDPEPDTTTANGAIWLLARQTYWSNPSVPPPRTSDEYMFAEKFYRERAVGPDYRWSWSNARLEYAEFRRTIRRSNNAYRNSLEDLGLVIANHALSTVDGFITVRLRRRVGDTRRYDVIGSMPFGRHR
jgi:hypothetical protein